MVATQGETTPSASATFKEVVSTGGEEGTPSENHTVAISGDIQHGTVTANVESAAEGATVTLNATPDSGYLFYSWDVKDINGNTVSVDENYWSFVMPASNVVVSARFISAVSYNITVDKKLLYNGSVSVGVKGAGSGETVTLIPEPFLGCTLESWNVKTSSGVAVAVNDDNTFIMPEDSVIVGATFKDNGISPNELKVSDIVADVSREKTLEVSDEAGLRAIAEAVNNGTNDYFDTKIVLTNDNM